MKLIQVLSVLVLSLFAGLAHAQGTTLSFGGLTQDPSAPLEVTSDQLEVSQADNSAIFTGNVIIVQGDLSLSAPKVTVFYDPETSEIVRLVATDGVTLLSPEEAAESQDAVYTMETGVIVMTGDVLLSQETLTLASEEMTVNLNDGTAVLTGRVRTVLRPQGEANGGE